MNFSALLVLLGLVATAGSRPASQCSNSIHHSFRHVVSDLQNSSVAPWTWRIDDKEDRHPRQIKTAECSECKVPNMTAKPIFLKVLVYIRDKTNTWKTSLYELTVGCTCVSQQQQ